MVCELILYVLENLEFKEVIGILFCKWKGLIYNLLVF